MSLPDLEDRLTASLRRSAEEVSVAASGAVRDQIHQRGQVLRRRRQTRFAIAGVALVGLTLGGALALREDNREEVSVGSPADAGQWAGWEPPPGTETPPAFSVDIAGLEPVYVYEDVMSVDEMQEASGPTTFQAFRRPGDYAGPTVYVTTGTGIGIPEPGGEDVETVDVAGHEAGLSLYNPHAPSLGWQLSDGRVVYITSWQVTADELLAFADGLQARPDGTGFDATVHPQGLAEDPTEPYELGTYTTRELQLEGTAGLVQINTNTGGEAEFESYVEDRFDAADAAEQVVVFDRPAVLTHYRNSENWSLQWRHTSTARVEVDIEGGDRAWVDEVIAGLNEIDDSAWQDLLARHGS